MQTTNRPGWGVAAKTPSQQFPEGRQGRLVTIGAQTVLARLLTGYDYGTPKASSYISHGQSSQSVKYHM